MTASRSSVIQRPVIGLAAEAGTARAMATPARVKAARFIEISFGRVNGGGAELFL